jgi:hypothetical protein
MSAPYLLTASGVRIDLREPRPADVVLGDLAHALARICRYTGHVLGAPYTVAQHSVHVAQVLRDQGHSAAIQAQGLLHDAHEAYTGDVASPIKRALRDLDYSGSAVWDEFEHEHAWAVRRRFHLPIDLASPIHAADLAMLMAEKAALMPADDGPAWPRVPAAPIAVVPWDYLRAEREFLAEAERLGVV